MTWMRKTSKIMNNSDKIAEQEKRHWEKCKRNEENDTGCIKSGSLRNHSKWQHKNLPFELESVTMESVECKVTDRSPKLNNVNSI